MSRFAFIQCCIVGFTLILATGFFLLTNNGDAIEAATAQTVEQPTGIDPKRSDWKFLLKNQSFPRVAFMDLSTPDSSKLDQYSRYDVGIFNVVLQETNPWFLQELKKRN